jgi:hypothetical protein
MSHAPLGHARKNGPPMRDAGANVYRTDLHACSYMPRAEPPPNVLGHNDQQFNEFPNQ